MAAAAKSSQMFTVTESFIGLLGKAEVMYRRGDLIASDHPAIAKWPQFFRVVSADHVEQATAAPGEKRA